MLLIQARLINLVSVIANKLVPSEDCALLAVFYRTSTCLLFPWDCTVVHCYSNDNQLKIIPHTGLLYGLSGPNWYQVEIAFVAVIYRTSTIFFPFTVVVLVL